MTSGFFHGSEFDWLRGQVEAVLWRPERPCRVDEAAPAKTKAEKPESIRLDQFTQQRAADALAGSSLSVTEYNALRAAQPAMAAKLPYVYQEYPCVLYRGGQPRMVENAREHERALRAGWQDKP